MIAARGDTLEIAGIVIATAWAPDGTVLEVAIHAAGERVYAVDPAGPGRLLARHARREILARGVLLGNGVRRRIRLTDFELLGSRAHRLPAGSPR